jgi:hypothetical protein
MNRLAALEAQNRLDEQGPYLERLSAATGISVQEILAEAERVNVATDGLNYRDRMAWVASDCGISVAELEAEANALLADDPDL